MYYRDNQAARQRKQTTFQSGPKAKRDKILPEAKTRLVAAFKDVLLLLAIILDTWTNFLYTIC